MEGIKKCPYNSSALKGIGLPTSSLLATYLSICQNVYFFIIIEQYNNNDPSFETNINVELHLNKHKIEHPKQIRDALIKTLEVEDETKKTNWIFTKLHSNYSRNTSQVIKIDRQKTLFKKYLKESMWKYVELKQNKGSKSKEWKIALCFIDDTANLSEILCFLPRNKKNPAVAVQWFNISNDYVSDEYEKIYNELINADNSSFFPKLQALSKNEIVKKVSNFLDDNLNPALKKSFNLNDTDIFYYHIKFSNRSEIPLRLFLSTNVIDRLLKSTSEKNDDISNLLGISSNKSVLNASHIREILKGETYQTGDRLTGYMMNTGYPYSIKEPHFILGKSIDLQHYSDLVYKDLDREKFRFAFNIAIRKYTDNKYFFEIPLLEVPDSDDSRNIILSAFLSIKDPHKLDINSLSEFYTIIKGELNNDIITKFNGLLNEIEKSLENKVNGNNDQLEDDTPLQNEK